MSRLEIFLYPWTEYYLTCWFEIVQPFNMKSRGFRSDQSLSHVWLFATPWIAARQGSLSITNSWSSLRLTSIIKCCQNTVQEIGYKYDNGLIGLGRSLEENGNLFQCCSCLENSMDKGAWWTTVPGVVKSPTWLSN